MKKFVSAVLALSLTGAAISGAGAYVASADDQSLTSGCKSAYLCDYNTGECIYKENELLRLPIASVCKVMTLSLCFDALDGGKINYDDLITVSERAAGMGGSQVFLEQGLKYKVSDLIKSIIVCSANDSCVAMSEAICGSEEEFVDKMNSKAEELGCADTLFANCTGLPKETQYSCARDVAVMFSYLIRHEDYFKYSKIWLEDFVHPDSRTISMTNTNKLIRKLSSCDGGKTGFTNQAGFCLVSTAIKDNLRLVSAVLGADTSDNRFTSAANMFSYGFANFKNKTVLDKSVNLNERLKIDGGKKADISIRPVRSSYVFSAKDKNPDVITNVILYDVNAPVIKGDVVGEVEVYKDGILIDTVALAAAEDAERAGFGDTIKKVAQNWTV